MCGDHDYRSNLFNGRYSDTSDQDMFIGCDESGHARMSRAMALVLEWAADHRDELMEDWNLCTQLKHPKPIESLR